MVPGNEIPTNHFLNPAPTAPFSAVSDRQSETTPSSYHPSENTVSAPVLAHHATRQPLTSNEQSPSESAFNVQLQHYRYQVYDAMNSVLGAVEHSVQFNDFNLESGHTNESRVNYAQFESLNEVNGFDLNLDEGDNLEFNDNRRIKSSTDNGNPGNPMVPPSQRRLSGHICPQCGRFFKQRRDLTRHIENIHRRLRPYVCITCSRNFGRRDTLVRHQRTAGHCRMLEMLEIQSKGHPKSN